MKRIIPLLLVLLLLCACVRTPLPPAAPEEKPSAETETAVQVQTQSTETETAAPEDTQQPESGTAEPEKETDEMKNKTVTLDGLDSYLRLTLPEGWTWAREESVIGERSILLSAPTDDGFFLRAVFWDSFGMCGTGVDFRELELSRGLTATLATETIQGEVWWTLILPAQPDQFTLQFNAPQAVIDAHQAEIDQMLDSLLLGALSHIQPQPTQQLSDK